MQFLIFTCSLVFSYFNYSVAKDVPNPRTVKLNNRFIRLINIVKFAPIIAFIILLVLVLFYFHTKSGIRLSHAWFISQFWAYATFFIFSIKSLRRDLVLFFPYYQLLLPFIILHYIIMNIYL